MSPRIFALLWVCFFASSSGCRGTVVLPPDPANESSLDDPIDPASATCTPLDRAAECPGNLACLVGACFDSGLGPDACGEADNGYCPSDEACVNASCESFAIESGCSPDTPQGFCPGGQACVRGYCFIDDGIACSELNLSGACPPGFRCTGGACFQDSGTCSSVIQNGTCPAWETCVQGECVGPRAPNACSAEVPSGRCPSGNICVGGTCVQITRSNVCAKEREAGLCGAAAACEGGYCLAITAASGCSMDNQSGLCPGGAVCQNGICVDLACESGGHYCPAGSFCDGEGACLPYPCDPIHPHGFCEDSTLICDSGLCVEPTCSPEFPEGGCLDGFTCVAGQCELLPCSEEVPFGACADGYECSDGVCVRGPCASDNLEGVCNETVSICHPQVGCDNFLAATCCDDALAQSLGCQVGQCSAPPCSTAEPFGACPEDHYCESGSCTLAPCSPFYPSGFCADAGETCRFGQCTRTGCATQDDPVAYCEPDICDFSLDQCVTPPCSETYPNGTCTLGTTCCDSLLSADQGCSVGNCFVPICSAQFPGGSCPEGLVCAGGECSTPACGENFPNGTCGPNLICDGGLCVLASCSPQAPQGFCTGLERCIDGSCQLYVCSAAFPSGPCPLGTLCENETCTTPACSAAYPGGACGTSEVCVGGNCIAQPCSSAYPSGVCGSGYHCVAGHCEAAACSQDAPTGSCTGDQAGRVCHHGVCLDYVCSSNFPAGPCNPGEICDASGAQPACVAPACSAEYIGGACPNDNEFCIGGVCTLPLCSVTVQNGQCPNSQLCCSEALATSTGCDLGTCTLADCSAENLQGRCDGGEICCDEQYISQGLCSNLGTCLSAPCSEAFLFGVCSGSDADKICVAGSCVSPCSNLARAGWCPGGFECIDGSCAVGCDADADCDGILDSHESTSAALDSDDDGSPDYLDRDSDNDGVPDSTEAGDLLLETPPLSTPDGDGLADFRDSDSDNDLIPDGLEVGPVATFPIDSDGDGQPDYRDEDSDGDGILDRCEASDHGGICLNNSLLNAGTVVDTDDDGTFDYLEKDSDGDGISDSLEARSKPWDPGTFDSAGVDSDGDGTPDYRDTDSDGDGVLDSDEDSNGDGIVNCQVDGAGNPILDTRSVPSCTNFYYDYNPGCPNAKCLLAETSRVHADTDRDGIGDLSDGIALVCSDSNLKPINVFSLRFGDYALTLDENFGNTQLLNRGGSQVGLRFHDSDSNRGSYAVAGFLLNKAPSTQAVATQIVDPTRELIEKALTQSAVDAGLMQAATNVSDVTLVINRNFTSFDGYGVVISRYRIQTSSTVSIRKLRDRLVSGLGTNLDSFSASSGGPTSRDFTLLLETRYRYDNENGGAVVLVGALTPTGTSVDDDDSYSYRTKCSEQSNCASRDGCVFTGGSCVEDTNYQLPIFHMQNIAGGSALAQFGDAMAALCQSDVQEHGALDFLWVVDNSGSMGDEIGQVEASSRLFFDLLGNTEADYRVGQTTTQLTDSDWPPQSRFDNPTADESLMVTDNTSVGYVAVNGLLRGGFTGAVAGQAGASLVDRDSFCSGGYDPACYFEERLPGAYSSVPFEYGLISGQWAAYRAGAAPVCNALTESDCDANESCAWTGTTCTENRCASESSSLSCDGVGHCIRLNQGACALESSCEWNGSTCNSVTCSNYTSQSGCEGNSGCAFVDTECTDHPGRYCKELSILGQTSCEADPRCHWYGWNSFEMCVSNHCAAFDENPTACEADSRCANYYWDFCVDEITQGNAVGCEWRPQANTCESSLGLACWIAESSSDCTSLAPRCEWSNNACRIGESHAGVLCSASNQSECMAQGGNFQGGTYCEWNASTSSCAPKLRYQFRNESARVMVILSDEEACSLRDGVDEAGMRANNGICDWFGDYGVGITEYESDIRAARMRSFVSYYRSRGFTVYAITGDKADPSEVTGGGNGGCVTASNSAEAGQGYIDVAEATGGGWGSICASDLYPSIESIVIGSIAKASPYRLEGFIGGANVQPIPATLKVVAEVCDLSEEYPGCTSGTHMAVLPRSRDNGFDYDAVTNAIIFYGNARPTSLGDVTVSYRYWVDLAQPPEGNVDCPCPETNAPSCGCDAGLACGWEGTTDLCDANSTWANCDLAPGCTWNTANGGECLFNGRCEPDPTCGGACSDTEVCNPETGLCECDLICGEGCAPGQVCDAVESSATCGACLCDTTCGGGCPAGQSCNGDPGSDSCGQCGCDITCAGGCEAGLECNADPESAGCGFCAPPQCGNCPSGFVCDPTAGICVCDNLCGGGCPGGTTCDTDNTSQTCGQCLCDVTCGGDCPVGTVCDSQTGSETCGLCRVDPTCGVAGDCNQDCTAGATETVCESMMGCGWNAWNDTCSSELCSTCNPNTGLCEADSVNCECGPTEVYDPPTLSCACDATCGLSCAPGLSCDGDSNSQTCGECICDTSCGGDCPTGLLCDTNAGCGGLSESQCGTGETQCVWESTQAECLSIFCGQCVVDTTCGGGCSEGEACNPVTGLCEPQCPACSSGSVCDPLTGDCICDQTCGGGSCPVGSFCDADIGSTSCGNCVCIAEAPAAGCPAGQLFDDGSTCAAFATGGACEAQTGCVVDASTDTCISPTCGQCVLDATCGGDCPPGFICDPLSGLCIPDFNCGGCPVNFECDPLTGACVPLGG